ncbi:MAG: SMC-Scp complex subunit ScpB [Candidatus Aenigmarchaeota archaeon]|nr:SMC-Scp complex subunit ScpB [Candidatus Aenigmarchaeota archaeon]
MNEKTQQRLALLEAALFTTTEPLNIEDLQKTTKIRREELERLMKMLEEKYSSAESGIKLSTVGGYRLMVKEAFEEKVSHLTPHADLSRGLLRVLSIIAYHEPIKQADIVKIVGNRVYDYVKELEEKGLVKTEKKSRTKVLSLTPQFEEYFGVKKKFMKEKINEMKNDEQDKEE